MHTLDITLENAKQYLIDESFVRPVLIDFWADWCAPCKNLMPILEKLAAEYDGAFLLAKVNSDELQVISSQFGVRSLPTVMLMKDGQPVDGFTGALPEVQVRTLLEKYLPKVWMKLVDEANVLMAAGDPTSALPLLRQAYEESKQAALIACLLAQCYLALERVDNAEALLATIKMVDQDAHYEQLSALVELKKQAAKTPELVSLEAAFLQEPNNLAIAFQLAVQYNAEKNYRAALDMLHGILKQDRNFENGLVKKTYTDILVALGRGDTLAIEYQRKLFTLLY
jgi:putative thioredoxin